MAINFNDKVLVTNPTCFHLGRAILVAGLMTIVTGVVSYFLGDFMFTAPAWIAFGVPTVFIGWVVMMSGLSKN